MTPGEIRIRRRALTVLRWVLAAAFPDEGCALLLGETFAASVLPLRSSGLPAPDPRVRNSSAPRSGGAAVPPAAFLPGDPDFAGSASEAGIAPVWEVQLIWPCLNVWQPAAERRRRFGLDPREQLLAQRWARDRNLQVLGAAHSHPCSEAVPSATDRALAFPPALQLILSPLQEWTPACWWLECDREGRRGEGTGELSVNEAAVAARPLPWRMVD